MHLQGEIVPRIKDLYEPREPLPGVHRPAQNGCPVLVHQPAQIASGPWSVGDHGDALRTVGELPRFADGHAFRQRTPEEFGDPASTPDALLEQGAEGERIDVHAAFEAGSETWPNARNFR